jgi:hypothetical protein
VRTARFNSKSLHLVNRCRARQAEPFRGTVSSADQPIGLIQYLQDVLPFGLGKCSDLRGELGGICYSVYLPDLPRSFLPRRRNTAIHSRSPPAAAS